MVLQCALECKIESPAISHLTLKSVNSSGEIYDKEFSINLSAPITVDDKVNFNKDMMKVGAGYPFTYKNDNYLAVKTSDKIIEIYKVKK